MVWYGMVWHGMYLTRSSALKTAGIPIADPLHYCDDVSIIGTPFAVYKYVRGRILTDPSLPGMTPTQRKEIYTAMNNVCEFTL